MVRRARLRARQQAEPHRHRQRRTTRFGIITSGKAYLDTRQALADLGLDDDTLPRDIGIRAVQGRRASGRSKRKARASSRRACEEILVVEEKRQIIEYQLKEELYNWRDDVRPRVVGKFDEHDGDMGGEWSRADQRQLAAAARTSELTPAHDRARDRAARSSKLGLPRRRRARASTTRIALIEAKEARAAASRRASTGRRARRGSARAARTTPRPSVPEGSRAMAGIGCHYMAVWMDREHRRPSRQMGGEGVTWIGQAPFTNEKHMFANLGDGTYFHSGLLAIRAAIAAKVNITYKILYNDAVAMTGGQPVDGALDRAADHAPARRRRRDARSSSSPTSRRSTRPSVGLRAGRRRCTIATNSTRVQRELREIAGTHGP